jgi:hypothetical protein
VFDVFFVGLGSRLGHSVVGPTELQPCHSKNYGLLFCGGLVRCLRACGGPGLDVFFGGLVFNVFLVALGSRLGRSIIGPAEL